MGIQLIFGRQLTIHRSPASLSGPEEIPGLQVSEHIPGEGGERWREVRVKEVEGRLEEGYKRARDGGEARGWWGMGEGR